ncbi:MAG: hypothetical protein M1573_01175 [Candidatus Parvarchaeota archaeon]|jgi:DNA-directed RNA polymerase subunit F|nr:hypothetical protein [Candidatus Parvarchaeota archaeon]MCL5017838.1 hypothetical protein [Candidatus Parvarchaeota archaeon]
MEYEIIDEKVISETEVKEKYMEAIEENSEMGKKLIAHIKKNIKIDDFRATFDELAALNLNIRDDYMMMLIDVSPTSVDQVRAILSPLKSVIKEEEIKKILAVLKKHL